MKYDFKTVEAKWQKVWEDEDTFHAEIDHSKPKFYALVEFPYPSAAGLHVGHPRSYTALDIVARKKRQCGYNVLYPMGWDAFGLPTENYALKNHINPEIVTAQNVARFKSQLKALGLSFDWDREINTTDPEYYKWTQWIFIQLFKKGLAYKKETTVNYCTGCKVVLANEEVVNGVCERCGSPVVQKNKSQWMLKITAYADRLINDLDDVDYIDRVKTQQRNWIGRSHGAEINFDTTAGDTLTVYTTRADTLFGATYMVISPEHAFIKKWVDAGLIRNADAVAAYQEEAARKSDFERTELNKEKTGVVVEGVKGIYTAGFTFLDNLTGGRLSAIRDKFVGFVTNIASGVSERFTAVKTAFSNGITAIKNTVTGAVTWFFESGKRVVTTFANGIKSAFTGAVDAVKGGLQRIRNMLPFSDAKEGPLSTLTLSGQRTMTTYAHGLELAQDAPAQAIEKGLDGAKATLEREPVQKVDLTSGGGKKEGSESGGSGEGSSGKQVIIQKLLIPVDLKKIKDLEQLLAMLKEVEDYAEANGSEEPADDQDAEPAPA